MDEFSAGYKTIALLVGSGGLSTIVVAWFGWRSHRRDAEGRAQAVPIQIESPWLVQNLLTMSRDIQSIRGSVDALTRAIGDMSVQVNTISALQRRRRRD